MVAMQFPKSGVDFSFAIERGPDQITEIGAAFRMSRLAGEFEPNPAKAWRKMDFRFRSLVRGRDHDRFPGTHAFNLFKAPRLRSTTRREVGSSIAASLSSCVKVRDTVSIVSPR